MPITITITSDDAKTATLTVPQPQVKAIREWMATQIVTPAIPGTPAVPATETTPAIPEVPATPAVMKYSGVRKVLVEVIADAINSRWQALATTTQIANKKAALEAAQAELAAAVAATGVTGDVPA
jgi:hypothetical protein